MKKHSFRYQEIQVDDGDIINIPELTFICCPQIIVRSNPEGSYVSIVWVERVEETEGEKDGT